MKYVPLCNIVYGFDKNLELDNNITTFLIEPRKIVLDNIKSKLSKNIDLIPKILITKNKMSEIILHTYQKKINGTDVIDCYRCLEINNNVKDDITISITGLQSKQKVYTTSLQNIIFHNNIKKVNKIYWNLNIDNLSECIDTLLPFNNIIDEIVVNDSIEERNIINSNLLREYYYNFNLNYINKNIDNEVPKIGMFLTEKVLEKNKHAFDLLILQYNITIIELTNNNADKQKSKYIYENFNNWYKQLFENDLSNFDIIIQFNPNVLENKYTFKINLSCDNNKLLYVDKNHDVIYGGKNTFFQMYEVINSEYFKEYIEEIKNTKKEFMFKLFNKRYFYEYLEKSFHIVKLI